MPEFDPGPPPAFAQHFDNLPDLTAHKSLFWFTWGPIFYRGRLDNSAKVLFVASDPGPTERVACRTLVGDAGQRVQGFIVKLGLTSSYVCVNAHPFALFPSKGPDGEKLLRNHATLKTWRNQFYTMLKTPALQAIVAFGEQAHLAVHLWDGKGSTPVFELPHPSSRNPAALARAWREAVPQLRAVVTPDPGGSNTGPNYGQGIKAADYARLPARDLPWGLPDFIGDDAWGRRARPRHNNCVSRPGRDLRYKLEWIAPKR
jgi:uracil-DNA glycosylase